MKLGGELTLRAPRPQEAVLPSAHRLGVWSNWLEPSSSFSRERCAHSELVVSNFVTVRYAALKLSPWVPNFCSVGRASPRTDSRGAAKTQPVRAADLRRHRRLERWTSEMTSLSRVTLRSPNNGEFEHHKYGCHIGRRAKKSKSRIWEQGCCNSQRRAAAGKTARW